MDTNEKKRLFRCKEGYQLWIAGELASIVKETEQPDFKRRISKALIYDWNALTGDKLDSID